MEKDLIKLIPDGYEINENDNNHIIDGDYFIYQNSLHRFLGYTGQTIKYAKSIGVKYVLKKIERTLTPEEISNKLKNQSRQFVDEYIKNPTKEIYLKYEEAFLKDDMKGL